MAIDLVPEIKKLPHIYGAHKDGRLIVFVGAGCSSLWGCKRWKDMAATLIHDCYEYGRIDYWARENLISKYATSPRKLITIAKALLNDNYLSCLKKTLEFLPERKRLFPSLFENLFALNASFITTNIDAHLSSLFLQASVHSDPQVFTSTAVKPKNIFHLHGIIGQTPLVLTIDEYITRYQNLTFRGFLEDIFYDKKNCFLFIGYGADEMEIIDYMIQKYSKEDRVTEFINRFYVLLPFFQNEESLLEYEKSYFDQINMSVIPYAIDAKGYDQLYEVIATWKEELTKARPGDDFYEFSQIIDKNL